MTNLIPELQQTAQAKYRPRPAADTNALILRAQRGGKDGKRADQELLLSNINLVLKCAARYRQKACGMIDEGDLFQTAALGFVQAVRHFDTNRSIAFSTYAVVSMKHHLQRALDNSDPVRIPVYQKHRGRQIASAVGKLTAATGREPTAAELAGESKLTEGQVKAVLSLPLQPDSLEALEEDEDNRSYGALKSWVDFDGQLMRDDMRRVLRRVLRRHLTTHRRRIVERLFGLKDRAGRCRSIAEVASEMGISRQAVHQAKALALATLREAAGPELLACLS